MTPRPPQLPQQATLRSFLRIGGPIVLGIGLVLTVVAVADFFSAFGSFAPPTNFWMAFIGLPMLAIGGGMMQAGYLGTATRYVAGEVAPTIKDTLEYVGVTASQVTCPKCGGTSAADARFCDDCGAPLQTVCAACGHENATGAAFCDQCGKPLTGYLRPG